MHYQYFEIGNGSAISEIATTEARHDRHTAVRHTHNRHTSCRCGSGCIPLAPTAGDLPADAACHGTPDCATHGTGARYRLGAGVYRTAMKARDRKRTGYSLSYWIPRRDASGETVLRRSAERHREKVKGAIPCWL